jgi:hypothetical protein
MVLTPRLRKLALTTHVTAPVGWLGAVIALLALQTHKMGAVPVLVVFAYPSVTQLHSADYRNPHYRIALQAHSVGSCGSNPRACSVAGVTVQPSR